MQRIYMTVVILLFILLFSATCYAGGTVEFPPPFESDAFSGEMRNVAVYLPEAYDPEGNIDYPVIYFLHGAYASHTAYWYVLKPVLDDLITQGHIRPLIMVAPDGSGRDPYGGTMWTNGLYGDFEDYVAQDVVNFIDANYRTVAHSSHRSILGFSDGANGAMIVGMKNTSSPSDVFTAVACHSGFLYLDTARGVFRDGVLGDYSGPPYAYNPNAGYYSEWLFALASSYSPNVSNPPYDVDLPFDENGGVVEGVMDIWNTFNADSMIASVPTVDWPGLYFDVGTTEVVQYPANQELHDALVDLSVPHVHEEIAGGGHTLTSNRLLNSINFLDEQMGGLASVPEDVVSDHTLRVIGTQPNPLRTRAALHFSLPEAGRTKIQLYSIDGRMVQSLFDEPLVAGDHIMPWQAENLPSGVYFYRLQSGDHVVSHRVVVGR